MLALRSDALCASEPPSRLAAAAAEAAPERVRLLDPRALTPGDLACWERLAETAAGTNPFAQPWLQRLSLEHCDPSGKARLAVVEAPGEGWIGAIPLIRSRLGPARALTWSGWSHPNQFTGTPLVRAGAAGSFWHALLGWLDRQDGLALQLHNLPVKDPVNRALFELRGDKGRRLHVDRRCRRALLDPATPPGLAPKLRRRIEGLERKLAREHGPLALEVTRDPARIAALIEPFVALEASGWKGRAGSALASRGETRAFFGDVALAAAARGAFELAVLTCGGRIVAMSTQLVCGGMLHGFKSAYDEAFASHAPGLLLLARMTRHWLDQGAARVDSCARAGQEPVSRLWPDGIEIADCRIALGGPLRRLRFAVLIGAEALWHGLKNPTAPAGESDKA